MNPRRLAALLCFGFVVVAVLGVVSALREPPAPTAAAPPDLAARVSAATAAIDVLRTWDLRRSRAWADGNVQSLRRLYTPRSRTGRHDRAALAAYVARGLRVTGVRMQLLEAEVERAGDDVLVLVITDQMTRAVARGRGEPVVLPRDQPSTWRVSLRRSAGEWRVVEVRRAPRPAPP